MSALHSNEYEGLLDRLIRALEHLAWPAYRQRAYLADLGVAPLLDELALEFDDALKPVQGAYHEFGVRSTAQEALNSIDILLTELTEQPGPGKSAWNSDALDSDKRWSDVRRLANIAHLELRNGLGEPETTSRS
jgi:hypothetical protein